MLKPGQDSSVNQNFKGFEFTIASSFMVRHIKSYGPVHSNTSGLQLHLCIRHLCVFSWHVTAECHLKVIYIKTHD